MYKNYTMQDLLDEINEIEGKIEKNYIFTRYGLSYIIVIKIVKVIVDKLKLHYIEENNFNKKKFSVSVKIDLINFVLVIFHSNMNHNLIGQTKLRMIKLKS